MSDLSNDTKKRTTKFLETIPLKVRSVLNSPVKKATIFYVNWVHIIWWILLPVPVPGSECLKIVLVEMV
jgi:hypothetical protein